MSRNLITVPLILVVLLTLSVPAWADDPVVGGLAWLRSQQQADGGFSNGFTEGSDLGTTCDIILAIASGGQDVGEWQSDRGNSPLTYLESQVAGDAVDQLGLVSKVALALVSVGEDPTAFGGRDLIAELEGSYDDSSGSYGGSIFDQALVMLALFNAGRAVPDGAAQYLANGQAVDGAWALFGETEAGGGDTNTTALVIQALIASNRRDGIDDALAYLERVQNDDGGFPYQNPSEYGTDTDANSTAVVLQALQAAGERHGDWAPGGTDPLGALTALYDPAVGAFSWQAAVPGPNVLATAQAIPALASRTFVFLPVAGTGEPDEPSQVEPSTPQPELFLPESGGVALVPLGAILLGATALSVGVALRRRR
jgi:hypothetical protein